jgi:hypothetical protein
MKLIYTPKDGGEPRTWEIDPNDLTIGETVALERVLDATMVEFGGLLERGSFTATRALLWIARRRDEPKLRIDDLDDIHWSELVAEVEEPDEDQPAATADETAPKGWTGPAPAVPKGLSVAG